MSPADPHPDAQFDADWLALRAPADTAARAGTLTALAARWLTGRRMPDPGLRPLRLADLGTGTGSNVRFLAPRLPGPQAWQMIDHDPGLLDHARANCRGLRACDGRAARFATLTRDLDELTSDDLRELDLVCASALIDLVSDDWLIRFALALADSGAATLITLSVDGEWSFNRAGGADAALDVDDDDALVRAAFNAHQRRDKGVGGALGPDAAPRLAHLLREQRYRVVLAPSPWRLPLGGGAPTALARAVLDGWRDAALEQVPDAASRISAWHSRRVRRLAQSDLTLTLGHVDVFACPADDWPAALS